MTKELSVKSKLPEISVVMSCYNAADFLAEAIESILQQTFTDFEFIVIDDGSSDSTLDIIKKYSAKDSRIVVIDKKNSGLTDSLNIGINVSRGRWIARLDADDIALPTRLEEQIAFVNRSAEIVLLGSDFIEIDQHGKVIKAQSYPTLHNELVTNLRNLKRFFPHSSAMYRSDLVNKVGRYSPRIVCAEDWDLWLRLAEYGKIACLNKPLVKIRKHSQQVSHDGAGRTQALHALAASVCHFLRSKGTIDPSTCDKDAHWRLFIKWIDLRVRQEMYFERQQEWSQLRQKYLSAGNKNLGAWRLVNALVASKNPFQIIHNKLFSSGIPETLANEWVRKQKFGNNFEGSDV